MSKSQLGLSVVFSSMLLGAVAARGADLRAGAAKDTITPDVRASHVYLAGFGNNRVATGVHDDLFVRCIALGAGDQTVIMCAADLIGLFYDDVLKIRELVKAQAPEVGHLIVASTHDHEGPDTIGLWGPTPLESGMDEKYMEWLDRRIAGTAIRAVHSMQAAGLSLSRDDHPALALLQADSRPPYVKDPHLFVMRLAVPDGPPIATLINWSDHPETLGGKNTEITADYPHWLCQYVERNQGGIAVFFNGSIGGLLTTLGNEVALQDPETGQIAKDGTWRKAELFGTLLGQIVAHAGRGELTRVDNIEVRSKVIFVPLVNDHFRAAGAAGVFAGRKPLYTQGRLDLATAERDFPDFGRRRVSTGHDVETEVDYLALKSGASIVAEVVTVPGEIYPELVNGGITRYPGADFPDAPFEPALREHLKSGYQFILGLANDELGYIIPRAEWDDQPPWLLNNKDRWYGEINSAGPDCAGTITKALVGLIEGRQ